MGGSMGNFIDQVVAMGKRVTDRLDATNDELRVLTSYFEQELKNVPFHEFFSLDRFAEQLLDFQLPKQLDRRGDFGQPALTLYEDPKLRFVIELYVWQNVDTAIHDHAFYGSGKVIMGKSLESLFRFNETEKVSSAVGIGKLEVAASRVLETGDVFRFFARNNYIHQVHHLHAPTLSLIGRTIKDLNATQSMYLFPGFRVGRHSVDDVGPEFNKRLELLQLLRSTQNPAERTFLTGIMRRSKPHTLWMQYTQFLKNAPNQAEIDELVSVLKEQFGQWAEIFKGMANFYLPDFLLLMLPVREPDEELFLHLLSLWGLGPKMNSVLESAFPDREASTIISDCTRRMARRRGANAKWLRFLGELNASPGKYSVPQLMKRYALTAEEWQRLQKYNVARFAKDVASDEPTMPGARYRQDFANAFSQHV